MDKSKVITFLDQVDLFKSLPEEYKGLLADRLDREEFAPGDIIVKPGDAGDKMYMLAEGTVSVVQVDEALGLESELARLHVGEVFGEMALLTGEPRSATCKAVEPTLALVLTQRVLMSLMRRVPDISITMCRLLAHRLSEVNRHRGTQLIDSSKLRFDAKIYALVPERILKRHKIIPISISDDTLTVATPDPNNLLGLDDVRRCVHGVKVSPVMISEADYRRFLQKHMLAGEVGGGAEPAMQEASLSEESTTEHSVMRRIVSKAAATMSRSDTTARPYTTPEGKSLSAISGQFAAAKVNLKYASLEEREDGKQDEGNSDPVELFDDIVRGGLDLEASDIHIEPLPDRVLVRYRVDGELHLRAGFIPRSMYRPLVSRVKVLASVDISERRLPQDGRIGVMIGQRQYDMRLSTMPTITGEKVVLRILDTQTGLKPLEELVVAEQVCRLVKRMVHLPYGMVIVCGPTGSGKTTTLYAALNERASESTNITTVEDPVEFNLPGINQVQVNVGIDLTFPAVLRGILRQNPDVILVGETRDVDTAKMALEAGLVGHLVLTSFHANTAAGALVRLVEMGMDPFTISYAVNGVINQRLVRRLCPACSAPKVYSLKVRHALERSGVLPVDHAEPLYGPVGCSKCRNSGYRGRIALFEVMTVTDQVREALQGRSNMEQLSKVAGKSGYVSLKRYAAHLLKNGLTTPEQILKLSDTSGVDGLAAPSTEKEAVPKSGIMRSRSKT